MEKIKIEQITPYSKNTKKHPTKQLAQIAKNQEGSAE